jgi:hypothetical protein
MKRNTEYYFTINASYHDCLRLYSGNKKHLVIRDEAGVKVSLPIHNIKPFITRQGIKGRFHLTLTEHQKIKEFTQIS